MIVTEKINYLDNAGIQSVFEEVKKRTVEPNMLINPDFSVNQRSISGAFSETGKYFVDRWRLVSGNVTVNTDGTLTLNGSICQVLDMPAGANVTASASAGTAVYDDAAKKFTVTGNNDIISWAKLERGNAATEYIPPEPASELLKCQQYYREIVGQYIITIYKTSVVSAYIPIEKMRITNPSVFFKTNVFDQNKGVRVTDNTGSVITGFTFSCASYNEGTLAGVLCSKTVHGQDRNSCVIVVDNANPICLDAEIY